MPELPEVETIKKGLEPICINQIILNCQIGDKPLRYPISSDFPNVIIGQRIIKLKRRGKYLVFITEVGGIIFHFGMSGRIHNKENFERSKHEHFIMLLESGTILSYYDPRRFGLILWSEHPILDNFCFAKLGIEALSKQFNGKYLYDRLKSKQSNIKNLLLDNRFIVGVGNIYASEALYMAKILPNRSASTISLEEYANLCEAIKLVLNKAIDAGGTTIRDFKNHKGELGYFAQKLMVYGRQGQSCKLCNNKIKRVKISNRSTFYCDRCQG